MLFFYYSSQQQQARRHVPASWQQQQQQDQPYQKHSSSVCRADGVWKALYELRTRMRR
jgi:hypothetical protein